MSAGMDDKPNVGIPPVWVRDAIFYEIFPDRFCNGDLENDPPHASPWGSKATRQSTFGGDLQGIIDRLDYLQDLGVNALYLTPIFKARSNHKYDTCDYFSIDPCFGSVELLSKLVNSAHKRDMRVLLDGVFNHCGDGFFAFEDVIEKGQASKFVDWFFIPSYPISQDPPNYQTFGGASSMPKFNVSNPEVWDYVLRVATHWIESCDIDGWRLDAPWKLPLDFLLALHKRVKQVKSDAFIVGEAWRDSRPWLRWDICDGVTNYTLRHNVLNFCIHRGMDAEDFDYETRWQRENQGDMASYQVSLLGSHDTPRLLTLCDGDLDRALLAYTFLLTYVNAPMIYYGDEIGMEGGEDPDCRRCMDWDQSGWNTRLHHTLRQLLQARRAQRALRWGSFRSLWAFNGIFVYLRELEQEQLVVVLNPREMRREVRVPLGDCGVMRGLWRDLLSGEVLLEKEGHLYMDVLPAKKSLILRREE